ncbi:MAG TPA: carbohydrate kinase [Intrasporangiaceae bacterium]|nr:carbohydrate kinase [Intrasporangiaceae bacterium]
MSGRSAGGPTVVAVDLGTGGPKVGLVGLDGRLLWSGIGSVPTERPGHGRAVQDAELWWTGTLDLVCEGLARTGIDPASVVGFAVTGQWGSTVPVDADGIPVGAARIWQDNSAARHSRDVIGGPALGYHPTRLATWLRRTAGAPSPLGGDPVSHLLGYLRDEPDVAARARWFLEPVDFLTMRLTGRASATAASMAAAWLVDVRGARTAYDPTLLALAGVDGDRLPPLLPPHSVVGPLKPDVADRLGLSPEVLVVSGMPDTHSAWAGAGRTGEGELHMAISTSSWISAAVSRKRTDVLHSIATMPGLLPGGYLIADNHEAAGASLAWVRDQGFGDSYEELTALAARSPAGANGVVFTPWLAGMRSPRDDRSARAGWNNLSHRSTRADLVRAVLEGVAHQAAWLLEPVLRFTPTPSESIRIIGGGARSDLWCQIHADVLGRPIVRVEDPMTAQLRGVGLAAGVALGHLDWADLDALVPIDRTFEPDPVRHTAYAQVTAELPRIHSGLKGTIGRLART